MEKNKPGVMFYFEILPALEGLPPWQRRALLEGMIYYARDGREPKLGRSASAVWALIRPILDRDDERYRKTVMARSKGGQVRAAKLREAREESESAEQKGDCRANVLEQNQQAGANVLEQNEHSAEMCSECQSTISNPQPSIPNPQTTISTPQSPTLNPQTTISTPQSPISNPQASDGASPEALPPGVDAVRAYCEKVGLEIEAEDFVEYYASRGWKLSGEPVRDWKALARRWHRKAEERRKEESAYGNYGIVI